MATKRSPATWALITALFSGTVASAAADHLDCRQVRDPLQLRGLVTVTTPALGSETGCKISRTAELCFPAAAAVNSAVDGSTRPPRPITPAPGAGPPANPFVCYRVKCPQPAAGSTPVIDPFGGRTVGLKSARRLCTPAVLNTTTTTTTTVTTVPPSPHCGFADAPACDGACGGGSACVPHPDGYCWCVQDFPPPERPCGQVAGPPACHGTCPDETPLCLDVGGTCQCGGTPTTTVTTLCPSTSTTTLNLCGMFGCFGTCTNGLTCVTNTAGECECTGPPASCGSAGPYCTNRECPAGQTCVSQTVYPFGPQCPSRTICQCQ